MQVKSKSFFQGHHYITDDIVPLGVRVTSINIPRMQNKVFSAFVIIASSEILSKYLGPCAEENARFLTIYRLVHVC